MSDKVRRIEEKDFQSVYELFDHRKSIEELKWLYTNPENDLIYNAFVSVDINSNITGVIGYITSEYSDNSTTSSGVIPMTWQLKKDYKGIAGVLLFKRILKEADFAIAIQGSMIAQDLYKLFKYKYLSSSYSYLNILDLRKFNKYTRGKNIFKRLALTAVLLPSYLKNILRGDSFDSQINLSPFTGKIDENIVQPNVFGKVITKEYVDWMLKCPLLDTYAFNIKNGNEHIGICILYIKELKNVKLGRIVHLPFLGNDELLWKQVIRTCLTFFKKNDCCLVSGIAHHKMCHKGYKKSGFINIKIDNKPIYIRDGKKHLARVDLTNWHIQYSEGDKAYRNF